MPAAENSPVVFENGLRAMEERTESTGSKRRRWHTHPRAFRGQRRDYGGVKLSRWMTSMRGRELDNFELHGGRTCAVLLGLKATWRLAF